MHIVVLSSLFPSSVRKQAGLFVRERMFRVAKHAELEVVSPVPWFPGQGLIRLVKPEYRPMPALTEVQNGIKIHYPRFLSFPGLFRKLDGRMMARAALKVLKRIEAQHPIDVIDSHFTYPDGLAATKLGAAMNKKVTVTLRGTELPHSRDPEKLPQLLETWQQADQMICVSNSLKQLAVSLGAEAEKFTVVGNGVDTDKFTPVDPATARAQLEIDADAKVLITVGGLVKRKGFHNVIECLPELLKTYPKLVYLVVGGASAEGNYEPELRDLAKRLDVEEQVRFLGPMAPEQLSVPLSAADAFVLYSANEGWANVILEAMSCGTPVIASDVGGNGEVVANQELGEIVPFGDQERLASALHQGLAKLWQRDAIKAYAADNHWDTRVTRLLSLFKQLVGQG